MTRRVLPDDSRPGAFRVVFGDAAQSWVDPDHPDELAFEYVQQLALALEVIALTAPPEQRLRVVHVGGAGMSLPRWLAWRRPGTAQIVLEPDAELTAVVRRIIPLPKRSGIKVRDVDGLTGIAAMPTAYADVVILDAFDGDQVPGELAGAAFLDQVQRLGRGPGLLCANVTDRAPFDWSRRFAAGLARQWRHVAMGAEAAVHKGRRFGNLVFLAAPGRLPLPQLRRGSAGLPFSYRWLDRNELASWIGGAEPFGEVAPPSPKPSGSKLWFQ